MDYIKKTLKNGLRVIIVPMKDSLTATVRVFVGAGSEYETKNINGISHFLEHMCFKGTTNRPQPITIAKELDSIGAAYNAGTGRDMTSYYAKAASRHFGKISDIVADLYLNPLFDTTEIDKERGVIVEEINMYQDTPIQRIDDVLMRCMYGDQPAGWDILGPKDVIGKITKDDFIAYRSKHYVAKNTVLVIAGNVSEEQGTEMAEKYFSSMSATDVTPKERTNDMQEKPNILLEEKDSDQSHLMLGFRAYPVGDERRWALSVLSTALGGGMSSRLFQRVRTELGAAYYIGSMAESSIDKGCFAIAAGVNNEKLSVVVQAIVDECKKIVDEPLSEEELQATIEHIIGSFTVNLETSESLARYYGFQEMISGKIQTPEEKMERYKNVTAIDVQKVAQDIFQNKKLNIALIGPKQDSDSLQQCALVE
ncbi:MAG: pitrilysin family protein [bacterium]